MSDQAVPEQLFKDVMATLPSPVGVITAWDPDDGPVGVTVSAFLSLSLAPPMVLVSIDSRRPVMGTIEATRAFGLNVLGREQRDVSERFAGPVADRFVGVGWRRSSGLPRLDGATGWAACQTAAMLVSGDHTIVTAIVTDAAIDEEALASGPLIYHNRRYGGFA